MSPRFKKILQITGVLVAAGIFIFGIYWVIFRPAPDTTIDNVNGVPTGQLPGTNAALNRTITDIGTNATLPEIPGQITAVDLDKIAAGGNTEVNQVVREPIGAAVIGPDGSGLQYYDRNRGQFFKVSADGRTKQLLTAATFASVQEVTWSPNGNLAILEFPDRSKVLYDFVNKEQVTLPEELDD